MGLNEKQMKERDESLKRLKITTYKDKKGYVFVSYKSDNWKDVFEKKVFELQDMGMRVYSDKNFNDTNHPWLDDMEKNIKYSSAVILFISREYLKSYATLIELLTAIKYKKELIPIYFTVRSSLFDELKNAVELEDDIVKMEPSEAKKLQTLMQVSDGGYAESIKNIWNDWSDKFSAQKFSVMSVVEAFEEILCKNSLKDNLFAHDIEALKNTIEDACRNAIYPQIFDSPNIEVKPVREESNIKDVEFVETSATAEFENEILDNSVEWSYEKDLAKEMKTVLVEQDNVSEVKKKTVTVTGDITYTLYGETYTENQSDMMFRFFAQVLKRHQDMVNVLPNYKGMNCVSQVDYTDSANVTNEMPSYFKACRYFCYENGSAICVGTAYSVADKLKKMALLLEIVGEDSSVFSSEQVKLPFVKTKIEQGSTTKGGNSTDISFKVYGEEFEANQTDMLGIVFSRIIKKHSDLLEEIAKNCTCVDIVDYSMVEKDLRPCYFKSSFNVYEVNGVKYSVGGGFSLKEKLRMISKLIGICGESIDSVVIEGEELVASKSSKKERGKEAKQFL